MPRHSINELADFSGHTNRTLTQRVRQMKLRTTKGPHKAQMVEFQDMFALRSPKDGDGEDLTPADRRNIAQAEKLEAETAIINKTWMPVADAQDVLGRLCDIVQQDVEKWDRDPAERREIVERLQEALIDGLADYVPGGE